MINHLYEVNVPKKGIYRKFISYRTAYEFACLMANMERMERVLNGSLSIDTKINWKQLGIQFVSFEPLINQLIQH